MKNRLYANVYVKRGRNVIWVNEYMRQVLAGKCHRTAITLSKIDKWQGSI